MKRSFSVKDLPGMLHRNYHWVVAAVLILMLFVNSGAINNLNSLHIIPVSEYLNISRAEYSLAFSAKTVFAMISTFLSGFVISRFGCRVCAVAGLIVNGLGFVALATMTNYPMLILGGALIGAAHGFAASAGAAQIVRVWFHRNQGLVLGLVTAATGIGGSAMCVLQTAAMEAGSFRSSFTVSAIGTFSVTLLVFLLVRNKPEDMGLRPLGDGEEITGKRRKISEGAFPGLPLKKMFRRPAFYLMLLCIVLSSFSVYMAFSTIRPFLLDCGFSAAQASGANSFMMLFLTGIKFFVGVFSDRIGAKKTNLIISLFGVAGLLLLAAVGESYAFAVFAVAVFTFALPLVTVMTPLISFSLFGYRAQAKYTGIFLAMISLSSFIAEYVSNLIYDAAHSYRPAFLAAAGAGALVFFLYLFLYKMAEKDKELPEAQ